MIYTVDLFQVEREFTERAGVLREESIMEHKTYTAHNMSKGAPVYSYVVYAYAYRVAWVTR